MLLERLWYLKLLAAISFELIDWVDIISVFFFIKTKWWQQQLTTQHRDTVELEHPRDIRTVYWINCVQIEFCNLIEIDVFTVNYQDLYFSFLQSAFRRKTWLLSFMYAIPKLLSIVEILQLSKLNFIVRPPPFLSGVEPHQYIICVKLGSSSLVCGLLRRWGWLSHHLDCKHDCIPKSFHHIPPQFYSSFLVVNFPTIQPPWKFYWFQVILSITMTVKTQLSFSMFTDMCPHLPLASLAMT